MNTKNYLFKENVTDLQYFCQVQVSKKFMAAIDGAELELLQWMRDTLAHRTATAGQVWQVHDELVRRCEVINKRREGFGPYLLLSYSPLHPDESGFFRIERTTGRHQSVLLPIIDCRGSVKVD